MKSFLSKFFVYFLAPLVTVILGVMKVPDLIEPMKKDYPKLTNFLDYFTIIGTVFIYYFSIFSPHKKYEKAQKRKWEAMEKLAARMIEDYPEFKFSINIMFVKYWIFYRIEPLKGNPDKAKFTWLGKIFDEPRELTGESVQRKFRLTTNQGVCGKAYRDGRETNKKNVQGFVLLPELVDEQSEKMNNFTTKQKQQTAEIIFVASCPLIIKEKEGDKQKKKAIGVLNIESKELVTATLFTNEGVKDNFLEKVANLGNIFTTLHV
jgi:hypothetical protein